VAFAEANQPAAKGQAVTWAANRQRLGGKATRLVEGHSLDEGKACGTVSAFSDGINDITTESNQIGEFRDKTKDGFYYHAFLTNLLEP
jgi:hypothetical protein